MSDIFGRTFCTTCKAMTVHATDALGEYACIHQKRHEKGAVLDSEIRFADALSAKIAEILDRSNADKDPNWVMGNMSAVSEITTWIFKYQKERAEERIRELEQENQAKGA